MSSVQPEPDSSAFTEVQQINTDQNRKRKRNSRNDEAAGDESDYSPTELEDTFPNRKGRKRAAGDSSTRQDQRSKRTDAPKEYKGVRGKRGLLEKLVTDVPLELIFEVFRYLGSLDILRLSRTSKVLRGILMDRSSEDIWAAARANVDGLPTLPPDLDEPQYANLAFESYCHNCMRKPCETIIWQCRMRCCKKCLVDIFYPYLDLVDHLPDQSRFRKQFIDMDMYNATPHLIFELEDIKNPWRYHFSVFLPSIVENILDELEQHMYKAANSQSEIDAYQEWLKDKVTDYKIREKHSIACVEWHKSRTEQRSEEIATIKTRRKEAIIEKVKALGWGDTVESLMKERNDPFSAHKQVNQARDLTERAWKNMKEPLVEFLTEQKLRLEQNSHSSILRCRFRAFVLMYHDKCTSGNAVLPMPSIGDVLSWRVFDDIWQIPFEQKSIEFEFYRCFQRLAPFISLWRSETEQNVLGAIQRQIPFTTQGLNLAKVRFKCTLCGDSSLSYSDIFAHECILVPFDASPNQISEYTDSGLFPFNPYDGLVTSRPWRSECIQYSYQVD